MEEVWWGRVTLRRGGRLAVGEDVSRTGVNSMFICAEGRGFGSRKHSNEEQKKERIMEGGKNEEYDYDCLMAVPKRGNSWRA